MFLPTHKTPKGLISAMPLLESFVSFAVATTTVILETVVQNAFYFRDLVAYYFGGGKKSDEIKLGEQSATKRYGRGSDRKSGRRWRRAPTVVRSARPALHPLACGIPFLQAPAEDVRLEFDGQAC